MFLVVSFIAKIVAEVIHEICGHGLFVLLFKGTIKTVYISIFWPYEFSYISWSLPSGITSAQMAWIYAGGILMCMFTSFITQAFLLFKKKILWHFDIALFWLAFWTFVNSTGYLIIGGLTPFGDVHELIMLGVLTSLFSLVIGIIIFVIGFVTLSWSLRKILIKMFSPRRASLGVVLFWFIIPMLVMVMLANPERGLQLAYLPLAFIPTFISFVIEYFLILSQH